MEDPSELPLAPLREDLRLSEAAITASGEPSWVIEDTVINRYYQIGWLEFECLLRWGQTPKQISAQITEETALQPDADQVLEFSQFLEHNQLLRPNMQATDRLSKRSEGNAGLSWKWWLHHYLFFRIPLLRPQRFLGTLNQALGWLFNRKTALVILLLSLTGIILVMHQWDTFTHDVVESFSMEGLLGFAMALIVGKSLHEMGHALVATRLGLRVAHMGVAFVVLWPMLYTDTGESWRLGKSRQRLAIASAGIITELSLAGLATLGWALCDPGPLRNGLLYLATTGWILSLALNASPFMRFDGYFILSDILDFPNLHERSSAQARIFLRRYILGLDEPWPEPFSRGKRRGLIAFAFVTWLYRLALFLGIAVAVYLLFFKLLGIFLFIVELSWFIFMPIWRELKHWWQNRSEVRKGRRYLFVSILAAIVLLLALPWRSQIHIHGVARAEQQVQVFSPYPAHIQRVHPEGKVSAGDTLAVLDQPDIASKLQQSETSMRNIESQLTGLQADSSGLRLQTATRQRLWVEFEQARSAQSEIDRLILKAPFDGEWLDINPDWKAGQWISNKEPIGVLIATDRWQADGYVQQNDVHRLRIGDPVRFYAKGQPTPVLGKVIAIGSTRSNQLANPMLASRFGGPLTTKQDSNDLAPTESLFHVLIQLDKAPIGMHETLGDIQVEGAKRSLLVEGVTHLFAVLLRESGF